jgi:hypothetical protein
MASSMLDARAYSNGAGTCMPLPPSSGDAAKLLPAGRARTPAISVRL